MDLNTLLGPIARSSFLAEYWEQQPLHVSRGQPGFYQGILHFQQVEDLLSSRMLATANTRLIRGEDRLEVSELVGSNGLIDPVALGKAFKSGYTVILDSQHLYVQGLTDLCDALRAELGYRFHTNIYVTPANSQGFVNHFDNHDVFALQLHGSKAWSVRNPPIRLPLRGETHDQFDVPTHAPPENYMLEPGDLLYLPRGYYHSAQAAECLSAHITLGVSTHTWGDVLLEALASACSRNVAMRESVPPGALVNEEVATRALRGLEERWAMVAADIDLGGALAWASSELAMGRRTDTSGHFNAVSRLEELQEGSVVRARSGALELKQSEETICIASSNRELLFPAKAKQTLLEVLAGNEVLVSDLGGTLNSAGKLVLVKRLVLEGLLEVVKF